MRGNPPEAEQRRSEECRRGTTPQDRDKLDLRRKKDYIVNKTKNEKSARVLCVYTVKRKQKKDNFVCLEPKR